MHKNVIWYGPSCTWSPSCASWHDLHHSTGMAPRSMAPPSRLFSIYNISHGYTYGTQANKIKTTIWLLPVVIIQLWSFHTSTIYKIIWPYHITCPCKNKLDASNLFLHILRGLGLSKIEPFYLRTCNHNGDKNIIKPPVVIHILTIVGETYTRKATYAKQVACQAWSKSHVRGHVKLARAASSHYATKIKITQQGSNNMIINAHIHMCSNRAKPSTHRYGSDTTDGFVA